MKKILETTKVREWVDIINQIVDEITRKSKSWETVSVKGQAVYTFSEPFPANSKFSVIYATIELYNEDYEIRGNTLTFREPPLEDGYPIKIRYIGSN